MVLPITDSRLPSIKATQQACLHKQALVAIMMTDPLCSACETIMKSAIDSSFWRLSRRPHHGTFESFYNATMQRCYICSTVLKRLGGNPQTIWRDGNVTWQPMQYSVVFSLDDEIERIKLNVYVAAPSDQLTVISFWMVPQHSELVDADVYSMRVRDLPHLGNSIRCLFTKPHLETSTSSPATLQTIREWYLMCRASHEHCDALTLPDPWCPSRLVDIGDTDQTGWKLHLTSGRDNPPPAYITLSYRWGSNDDFKLTESKLKTGFRGQIKDLPQTFKDAIVVARLLSVRFLWIDRLCIIQDSASDWSLESETMRDIYANSLCNIAASASTNPDGGLFRLREPEIVRPGTLTASFENLAKTVYHIVETDFVDHQVFSGPLHTRGWVFQERILAPRTIHFAEHQVFWECSAGIKCEYFPQGVPMPSPFKNKLGLSLCPSSAGTSQKVPDSTEVIRLWTKLVEQYTQCSFTDNRDRLIAFCGIARLFQGLTGDQYAAGLWKSQLVDELSWFVREPAVRSCAEYRAPTWSWASISGPVVASIGSCKAQQKHVEVLDVQVQSSLPNSLGSVIAGTITLRGSLLKATCATAEDAEVCLLTIEPQHSKYRMLPDVLEAKLKQGCILMCLPLRTLVYKRFVEAEGVRTSSEEVPRTQFLVLKPSVTAMDVYERIGLLQVDMFDWIERSGIKITEEGLAVYTTDREIPKITFV